MPDQKIYYDEQKIVTPLQEGPQKISALSSFSIGVNSAGQILPTSAPSVSRFGGTGADGNLIISSGTTTINLGSALIVEKNYQIVNIASGATLTFSNANSAGTVIILRCLGDFICSGTITVDSFGGIGGGGGTGCTLNKAGAAGGGGASMTSNGGSGGVGSVGFESPGVAGTSTNWIGVVTGGKGGTTSDGAGGVGGVSPSHLASAVQYVRFLALPGSGGAGGACSANGGGGEGDGGAGGAGGGSLYVECNTSLYFTGTITAKGANGANGVAGAVTGAGGGGGGGGAVVILYKNLIINSGTITVTGGTGGTGGAAGGNGGAGFSLVAQNTLFG